MISPVWNHRSDLRFAKCSKCPTANIRPSLWKKSHPPSAGVSQATCRRGVIPEGGNLGMMGASNQNRRVVSVWPFLTWSVKRGGEVPLIWYGKTPAISNLLEKNCTWITASSQVCCIFAFSKRPTDTYSTKRAVRYQIFGSSTQALYVKRQGWN